MHVVFATSLVPCEDATSGYEIANRAILDALRDLVARVTVLGYTWPSRAPERPEETELLGEVDVKTSGATAVTKLRWLAASMAAGVPFASAKLRLVSDSEFSAILDRLQPNAFILNGVTLAGAYERQLTGKPYLFVAHNVEHRTAAENATAASGFERHMFRRESRLLERLERRLCGGARYVFTLAEEDRDPLGVASPDRSAVLPLTTMRAAPLVEIGRRAEYDLALIGTWTWAPNRIGLEWFLSEVATRLPADFDIRVAGSTPEGFARRFPRARFVGRVPDAVEFVRAARVVPLASRAGTGVQLKTIETFELGLPSVATSSAVRGIASLPANCTVTNDPGAFADALAGKVDAMRNGKVLDVDGRAFHKAQRAGIAAALEKGLARLGNG